MDVRVPADHVRAAPTAGQGFVRRTDRDRGSVHETAWTLATTAMRTFEQILRGEAR
ncbi:hypothetical protein ACI2LC_05830 [Nonomuraea wenchangensis]|uniref:hypothetical protein n=1 Tax=Nonomuraea wenchangensis TaxID=568860 RepID=UPI00384B9AFF